MIKHLACIMDGNRRWARQRGILPWYGHRRGAETVRVAIDFCLEHAIEHLSLYAFSLENFKRPAQENEYLFQLLAQEIKAVQVECEKLHVRICFIGDRTLFPTSLVNLCDQLEERTASFDRMQLNVLFCYGARSEIVSAVKKIATKISAGQLSEQDLSPELIEEHLWTSGIPAPELIVRTGGARRLSNFLLYQAAYSELYFLDCLWPDLTKEHLQNAVTYFHSCRRNFGT